MDNNEINMAIAKIRDLHFYEVEGNGYILACDCKNKAFHQRSLVVNPNPKDVFWGDGFHAFSNWSRSIGAAFELVAGMPHFRLARLSSGRWQCQSAHCADWGDHVIDGESQKGTPYHCGCIYADADTAPRAISLAFLSWKQAKL